MTMIKTMTKSEIMSRPKSQRRLAAALALDPVPAHWPQDFIDDQIHHMAECEWGQDLSDYAAVATERMERILSSI